MKRVLFIALLLFAVMAPSYAGPGVNAQSASRLASLRVGLWPEYDKPSLLVILWGELAPETVFPSTVSLRMPARVVAPHVVAAQPALDQGVNETAYETVIEGDWRVVTFEVNGPSFQFEYYDSLRRDGSQRSQTYTWPGDYAVESLSIEFQQPNGASSVVIDPALPNSQFSASDNLVYLGGNFGALEAGQLFSVRLSYMRDTDALTASQLSPAQSQAAAGGTGVAATPPAQVSSNGVDTLLLVVVAVVSFLLGAAAMRVAINIQTMNRSSRRR